MDFYMTGVMHNLNLLLNYKKTVEAMVYMNVDEILGASFPANIKDNIRVLRQAFKNPKIAHDIIARKFNDKEPHIDGDTNDIMDNLS